MLSSLVHRGHPPDAQVVEKNEKRPGGGRVWRFTDRSTLATAMTSVSRSAWWRSTTTDICMDDATQQTASRVVNDLLLVKSAQLPDTAPANKLCTHFLDFFESRVVKIRQGIEVMAASSANRDTPSAWAAGGQSTGSTVRAATEEEVAKVIRGSNPRRPALTLCLQSFCMGPLSLKCPFSRNWLTSPLVLASFPWIWRRRWLCPLLRKPGADRNNYQNYRPVSNLSFVAKVVEKVASKRLSEHLERNNLHEELQLAYRPCHSPETVLFNVQHDIAVSLGNTQAVLLVLLDMSAAYDTTDGGRFLVLYTYDKVTISDPTVRSTALGFLFAPAALVLVCLSASATRTQRGAVNAWYTHRS